MTPVKRPNNALILAPLIAGGLFILWATVGALQSDSYDFWVFMEAGRKFMNAPGLLYEWTSSAQPTHVFLYPPFFAMFFAPLSLLPQSIAFGLWGFVSLLSFWVALVWLGRSLGLADEKLPRWAGLTTLIVGAGCLLDLEAGQVNQFLFALLATGIALLRSRRPVAAGLMFAFAAHFKALPVVLLIGLFVVGQERAAIAMVLGLVGGVLALGLGLCMVHGTTQGFASAFHLNVDYVGSLAAPTAAAAENTTALSGSRHNLSLPAAFRLWGEWLGSDARVRYAGLALGTFLTGIALKTWRRAKSSETIPLALGTMYFAVTVSNVTCWTWHLPVLALPVGAALAAKQSSGRLALVFAAASVFVFVPAMLALNPATEAIGTPVLAAGVPAVALLVMLCFCLGQLARASRTTPPDASAPPAPG